MKNWLKLFAFAFTIILNASCSPDDEVPPETKPEFTFSVVDDSVYFQLISSGYQSVEWDFGDGTTSNEPNPRHGYKKSGQYEVYLRVRTPKNTVSNENLYWSKTPIVDRASYKETFTSKTVVVYYQRPIPAKINEEVNVGFSYINTLIDWGNPIGGEFENYFEFAYDSLFSKPAYGFLKGGNIHEHITGIGEMTHIDNSWFDIRFLHPATTYYYRVKQIYTRDNGNKDTFYTRTVEAKLNEMPVGSLMEKQHGPIITYYDLEFDQEDPFYEIIVSSQTSLNADFSKTFKPFKYSTSGEFINYLTLGETVYMRSKYHYRHDSVNYNGEVIESFTSNEKYMAKHYDQSDELFRGNDLKVEEIDGAYIITLGTTEKVVFYLKNVTQDKFYYLQQESEDKSENFAIYYNAKGEKHLISERARLYVFIEKIEGTSFSLCLVKDQNNRDYIDFKNTLNGEYKGFDGFIFRIED